MPEVTHPLSHEIITAASVPAVQSRKRGADASHCQVIVLTLHQASPHVLAEKMTSFRRENECQGEEKKQVDIDQQCVLEN